MPSAPVTISRNAPCPCGSGKKYKHCCLGKPIALARGKRRLIAVLAMVAVVVAAIVVGWYWGSRNGIFSGIVGGVVVGAVLVFLNAPRSRGRSGADRIDFGRGG